MNVLFRAILALSVLLQAGLSLAQEGPQVEAGLYRSADSHQVFVVLQVPSRHHITDKANGFLTFAFAEGSVLKLTGPVGFPKGEDWHGEEVYRGMLTVALPVDARSLPDDGDKVSVLVGYQMCQEEPQEVCFMPAERTVEGTWPLPLQPTGAVSAPSGGELASGVLPGKQDEPVLEQAPQGLWARLQQRLERELKGEASFLLFVLVFVLGIGVGFTPCVYPVIPIIMGFVGARAGGKRWRGLGLSLFFVLGLALVYSSLGVLAAATGSMMGISFQNPWVLGVISLVFLAMGLSMAGLFSLPVPSSLAGHMNRNHGYAWLTAMMVGGISGLVAAPCVGPVLVAILSWISQTGNLFLGFWVTFTFSLGMGVLFIVVGTFSGALSALPGAGGWMERVKQGFALILVAAALYFGGSLFPVWGRMLIWGTFLVFLAALSGGLRLAGGDDEDEHGRWGLALALLTLLVGAGLIVSGLTLRLVVPHLQVGQLMADTAAPSSLPWLGSLEEGREKARKEGRLLLIDTAADWCTACHELEEKTFSDKRVVAALQDGVVLVRLDFTKKDDRAEELRRALGILGMPTLILEGADGRERSRKTGFVTPDDFLVWLNQEKKGR